MTKNKSVGAPKCVNDGLQNLRLLTYLVFWLPLCLFFLALTDGQVPDQVAVSAAALARAAELDMKTLEVVGWLVLFHSADRFPPAMRWRRALAL